MWQALRPRRSNNAWLLLFAVCFGILAAPAAHAENWPAWRGPHGDGTSQETNLPTTWSETEGVVWKTQLPEWGNSTPAIWDQAIFLTTQQGNDTFVLKLKAADGSIEWTKQVGSGEAKRAPIVAKTGDQRREQKFHDLQNLASPSPVTDGKLVVVHFGNGDLAAYDFDGRQKWLRNLQADHGQYTIWWGHANSPVLFGDLVISVCMQDSLADQPGKPSPSYLVAHELATGKERWKTMRMTEANAEECDAYTTPVLAQIGGRTELIIMGGNQVDAYDPATGKQLWFLPGIKGNRTITGPTVAKDHVYVTRGMRGPLLAVKLGGSGKLDDEAVVWRFDQGTPDSPSPIVWNDLLFTVTDDGIGRCVNRLSGQLAWKERLPGDHKASPIAADGKIYFLNTAGLCTVVAATEQYERLAENQLSDTTIASPAISGGRIYIRGRKALYCLGEK